MTALSRVLPLLIIALKLSGIQIVPLALADDVSHYSASDQNVTDDNTQYNATNDTTDEGNEEDEEDSVEEENESSYGLGPFEGMSIMPLSCINFKGRYMMKYQIFSSRYNFKCHANAIGTYVISVSNYMRHYFNHQSIRKGEDFELQCDAQYLNCVQLKQYENTKLYARIGCLERENFVSTKLAVHLYTDKKCSQPYDDGQSAEQRKEKGYLIDDEYFETRVTFRPPFYACEACRPQSLEGFNKQDNAWFDDDGLAQQRYFDDWIDDLVPNDDAYAALQPYVNNERIYEKDDDDSFYTAEDDNEGRRQLSVRSRESEIEKLEQQRALSYHKYSNNETSYQNWNMCSKVFQYSVMCDEYCRSLDKFRIDEWPTSSIVLLGGMMAFIWMAMSFILWKRSKAYDKALVYADDDNAPDFGIIPCTLATIFLFSLIVIGVLAGLRLVNVTLLVAAGGCLILLWYLLKIVFFNDEQPALPQIGDAKTQTNYVMT